VIAMEIDDASRGDQENASVKVFFSNGQDRVLKGKAQSYFRSEANGQRFLNEKNIA